jgi:integrase
MARQVNRLSARAVATLVRPGRHADGGNLYLAVDPSGARRWVFLFRSQGRLREMGLGSARTVTLARARELAARARTVLAEGGDPLDQRTARTAVPTFGAAADALVAALSPGWRNPKHAAQWRMTLTEYAAPLRGLPVDRIDTAAVLAVLQPLWTRTPETASRLRGRIESVLDAATAQGHREGANPARWRGHLDHLLPRRPRLAQAHHAALPVDRMPDFMAQLRAEPLTPAGLALQFCILTATRSGEVLGARCDEIEGDVWTVPAGRMKGGRPHRVPLSASAQAVLAAAPGQQGLVFGRLATSSLTRALRRIEPVATVHGFRSTFRDWASERTGFPHDVCEAALAHAVASRVVAAYRRGDLLERRRELMEAWAAFLAPAQHKDVRLGRASQ